MSIATSMEEKQRVVVIQDVSRQLNPNPIRWALVGLLLKPGDKLTLVGVLHEVITPMGYKIKVDTGSKLGANMRIIKEAAESKKNEYHNSSEIVEMTQLLQAQEVEFMMEVVAGTSRKEMIIETALNHKATWIIIDRHMKKDEKYFLQKLSCGIARMKNNDQVEQVRGPDAFRTYGNIRRPNSYSRKTIETTTPSSTVQDVFNINGLSATPETEGATVSVSTVENIKNSVNDEDSISKISKDSLPLDEGSTSTLTSNELPPVMCSPIVERAMIFTYEQLQAATNGFSLLCDGESIYGFMGKLDNEVQVVVRKSSSLVEDFEWEINVMRKANHRNIVRVLGFCSEANQRLIVYEFAWNGMLSDYISEESSRPLTWTARIKVTLCAARGLLYLHENRLIHNDIRSTNIFLTGDLDPLVGYFSLGKNKDRSDDSLVYRAPEYEQLGIVSSKTDVFSFGIVLLELISGRVTTHLSAKISNILVWARPLLKNKKYDELLDPRLVSSHDPQQLVWMAQVTQLCLTKNPKRRLTMDRVVSALEFISYGDPKQNLISDCNYDVVYKE